MRATPAIMLLLLLLVSFAAVPADASTEIRTGGIERSLVAPSDHFYSPTGNIECVYNVFTAGPPKDRILDCITFNNRHVGELGADGTTRVLGADIMPRHTFRPGHSPVLGYGSRWTRYPFTCSSASAGMTCASLITRRGFTINRDGITRYPTPRSPASAAYITEDVMTATFEEQGIRVQGRHLSWLQVVCLGQGRPNGTDLDRDGLRQNRYHLFLCYGTISDGREPYVHATVFTWPGHPGRFRYRYQLIRIL